MRKQAFLMCCCGEISSALTVRKERNTREFTGSLFEGKRDESKNKRAVWIYIRNNKKCEEGVWGEVRRRLP